VQLVETIINNCLILICLIVLAYGFSEKVSDIQFKKLILYNKNLDGSLFILKSGKRKNKEMVQIVREFPSIIELASLARYLSK